jgi:hypothetical protein
LNTFVYWIVSETPEYIAIHLNFDLPVIAMLEGNLLFCPADVKFKLGVLPAGIVRPTAESWDFVVVLTRQNLQYERALIRRVANAKGWI